LLGAAGLALLVIVGVVAANELATRASYRYDATWDSAATSVTVPYLRGKHNEILLPAWIDGEDADVCYFDTGSTANGVPISSTEIVATDLVRSVWPRWAVVWGAHAVQVTDLWRSRRFAVGPVSLHGMLHPELPEMASWDVRFSGRGIASLCGLKLARIAIVEIDWRAPTVVFHRLEYPPADVEWLPLVEKQGLLHVRAHFSDARHEGLFLVDTGMHGAVSLEGHAVAEHRLLDGLPTSVAVVGGIGGSAAESFGTLERFELAGRAFRDVRASFGNGKRGARERDGIIGRDLLRHYRVIIDTSRARAAFVPYER
jgi:hypothetical protein